MHFYQILLSRGSTTVVGLHFSIANLEVFFVSLLHYNYKWIGRANIFGRPIIKHSILSCALWRSKIKKTIDLYSMEMSRHFWQWNGIHINTGRAISVTFWTKCSLNALEYVIESISHDNQIRDWSIILFARNRMLLAESIVITFEIFYCFP